MSFELGDRFEYLPSIDPPFAKIVEFVGEGEWIVVSGRKVGTFYWNEIEGWLPNNSSDNWKYLGNFSKVDNFNELYDLLNQ